MKRSNPSQLRAVHAMPVALILPSIVYFCTEMAMAKISEKSIFRRAIPRLLTLHVDTAVRTGHKKKVQ
jgi:hypothetical protein